MICKRNCLIWPSGLLVLGWLVYSLVGNYCQIPADQQTEKAYRIRFVYVEVSEWLELTDLWIRIVCILSLLILILTHRARGKRTLIRLHNFLACSSIYMEIYCYHSVFSIYATTSCLLTSNQLETASSTLIIYCTIVCTHSVVLTLRGKPCEGILKHGI